MAVSYNASVHEISRLPMNWPDRKSQARKRHIKREELRHGKSFSNPKSVDRNVIPSLE